MAMISDVAARNGKPTKPNIVRIGLFGSRPVFGMMCDAWMAEHGIGRHAGVCLAHSPMPLNAHRVGQFILAIANLKICNLSRPTWPAKIDPKQAVEIIVFLIIQRQFEGP